MVNTKGAVGLPRCVEMPLTRRKAVGRLGSEGDHMDTLPLAATLLSDTSVTATLGQGTIVNRG